MFSIIFRGSVKNFHGFFVVFQATQARNFGEKIMEEIMGPVNWMLNIPLETEKLIHYDFRRFLDCTY